MRGHSTFFKFDPDLCGSFGTKFLTLQFSVSLLNLLPMALGIDLEDLLA